MGGRNKALLEIDGQRIVDRQLAVLAPLAGEVLLVTGDPVPYSGVRGARVVLDRHPGLGPLAGIQAAFYASAADALLVIACDLPFLDGNLVRLVRDHAPGAQAVVPRLGERPQPLHARFARSALPAIDARLARGALSRADRTARGRHRLDAHPRARLARLDGGLGCRLVRLARADDPSHQARR